MNSNAALSRCLKQKVIELFPAYYAGKIELFECQAAGRQDEDSLMDRYAGRASDET